MMKRKNWKRTIFLLFAASFSVFILALIMLANAGPEYEILKIVKPVTIMQYSGFLSFAFLLNILKPLFFNISENTYDILIAIAFFCIMAALFEMLWSLGYWFSTYELKVIEGEPDTSQTLDTISYKVSPKLKNPFYDRINLNRSFKKNTLFFMMSVYFTYFLLHINNKGKNKNENFQRRN